MICPIYKQEKPKWKIYGVRYPDYLGLICHECNKKKYAEEQKIKENRSLVW